jgi:phosphoribosylanthranilate isomerase
MPKTNTLIKICGLTSEEQALQVAKLGAHAIGIISVEESPRYVSAEIKKQIFKTLESFYPEIDRVSVVQNYPIDLIIKNFLDNPSETIIQLHGDEDIDYCKKIREKIPNIGLWKAFRIKTEKDLDKIKPFEELIDAILLDSWNEETYGGSGKKIKSSYLKNLQFSKPWWLAGGISIKWNNEILTDIKPDGLDISSSIEFSPGLKDIKKTEDLFNFLKNISNY